MTSPILSQTKLFRIRSVLFAFFLMTACIYFPWRITVFNPSAPVFSTIFFFVEVMGFVTGVIYMLSVIRFNERTPVPAPEGLSVDVFIPTYNEPLDVVRNTVIAALAIRYPHETWLLDDGNREEMRRMAEELGCRYLAREDNTHAKAGNINNALKHATGDFILLFDADFIAAPYFLDRTLGYFTDEKVAFVQTPQEFYNFDSFQHIGRNRRHDSWSEHSLFYRIIQRGRNAHNAAMFCGCAAVLRRRALDAIGGMATGSVTEDMHTSVRLHGTGWDSVYHPETLSAGLAPHDAPGFRKQRLRWAQGAMQVMRHEHLLTHRNGLKLTFLQRASYLLHVLTYMEGLRYTFVFTVSAITLFFLIPPMDVTFGEWALYSVPFVAMGILSFEELSRGHGRILNNEVFNLARFPAYNRSLLALFGKKEIRFVVTPKVKQIGQNAYFFPWLILGANTIALAKTAAEYVFGTPTITGWPLLVVVAWAGFTIWMALRVCFLTMRCNKNRRSFSRFPVEKPVILQQNGESYEVTVSELCDKGITIRGERLPTGLCTGTIDLDGQKVMIEADLSARGEKQAGGPLRWKSQSESDRHQYLLICERITFLSQFDRAENWSLFSRFAKA